MDCVEKQALVVTARKLKCRTTEEVTLAKTIS